MVKLTAARYGSNKLVGRGPDGRVAGTHEPAWVDLGLLLWGADQVGLSAPSCICFPDSSRGRCGNSACSLLEFPAITVCVALNIQGEEVEQLARELANRMGTTIMSTICQALRTQLALTDAEATINADSSAIITRGRTRPILGTQPEAQILGNEDDSNH